MMTRHSELLVPPMNFVVVVWHLHGRACACPRATATSVATYSHIMTTTSHEMCMIFLKELPLCISRNLVIVPYLALGATLENNTHARFPQENGGPYTYAFNGAVLDLCNGTVSEKTHKFFDLRCLLSP